MVLGQFCEQNTISQLAYLDDVVQSAQRLVQCVVNRKVPAFIFPREFELLECHERNVHVLGIIFACILERSFVFLRVGICRQFIFPYMGYFSRIYVWLYFVLQPHTFYMFPGQKNPMNFSVQLVLALEQVSSRDILPCRPLCYLVGFIPWFV